MCTRVDVDQWILQTEKARQIDQWWSSMTSLTFVFMKMPNRSFSIKLPFVEINERIISWYGSGRNKMEAYGLRVNVEVDVHRATSFAWEESEYVFFVPFTIDEWQRQVKVKNDCFHLISRWSRGLDGVCTDLLHLEHTHTEASQSVSEEKMWLNFFNKHRDRFHWHCLSFYCFHCWYVRRKMIAQWTTAPQVGSKNNPGASPSSSSSSTPDDYECLLNIYCTIEQMNLYVCWTFLSSCRLRRRFQWACTMINDHYCNNSS